MPEYPLEPDPRADIVAGSKDFVIYQSKMPELFLKPEVPDIIREHVRIAQQILKHSYFIYEFLDVAFMQVLFALEKALRLRYQELEKKDDEKLNLFQLSKWATSNNFFELADQSILDIYRKIRNGKVHEPKNTLGGTLYLQRITEPIGFINDLYEDVELRIKRKAIWEELYRNVTDIFKPGATLTVNNATIFVRDITVAFVNNKRAPTEYYFSMMALTDPASHSAHQMFHTENLIAVDVKLDADKKVLTGILIDSHASFVISALDTLGLAAVKFWEKQIIEIHTRGDGEHAMSIDMLAGFSVRASAEQLHTKALFDFYRS